MDKKPKAGGASRKAKEPKLEDREQSERFIETARKIASDVESLEAFDAAIDAIIKTTAPKQKR
jgi:hypothetical protein